MISSPYEYALYIDHAFKILLNSIVPFGRTRRLFPLKSWFALTYDLRNMDHWSHDQRFIFGLTTGLSSRVSTPVWLRSCPTRSESLIRRCARSDSIRHQLTHLSEKLVPLSRRNHRTITGGDANHWPVSEDPIRVRHLSTREEPPPDYGF